MGVKSRKKKSKNVGVRPADNGDGWMIDIRLKKPDGSVTRRRKCGFESEAKAAAAAGKLRAEALEGRYFDRERSSLFTVEDAWLLFKPIAEKKHRSIKTTLGRAGHILRHLGKKQAITLTQKDIDNYCRKRKKEQTRRKAPPTDATLNREVALLRRILNFAVKRKDLSFNPISQPEMLVEDNVRNVDIPEVDFQNLIEAAEQPLRSFLLIAHDSGLRKSSILRLRRSRIDSSRSRAVLKFSKGETKTNKAETVVLTKRATAVIKELLDSHDSDWVFLNPHTDKPYVNLRKMYKRALVKAELQDKGYWIHDQRRMFITQARRRGIDESTIMSLSKHKTRSAFERYNIVATKDQEEAIKKYEGGPDDNVVDLNSAKAVAELKNQNERLLEENEALKDENIQLKRTLRLLLDKSEAELGAVNQ